MSSKRERKRPYSRTMRLKICAEYLTGRAKGKDIAAKYGITPRTLQYWLDDYKVDYDTYESDLKKAEIKGFNEGLFSGALGMTLLGVLFGVTGSNNETKQTNEFIDNISKIASSDSIKQNEFSVKDMNKDNHPDLVLYKKDGSKVILDLKNQQINTEQKKLDVIK